MAANWGVLSGLLGAFGGGTQQIGNAIAKQREEELAREKLAIEQQRADQLMTLQQNQLAETQATRAQQQRQFEATQASDSTPLAAIYTYLGMPVPANVNPADRVKTVMADKIIGGLQTQQAEARAAEKLAAMQGAILNQPSRPDVPVPADAAMYSADETLAGKAATPKNAMLAAILGHPQADAILKQMYPEDTEKTQIVSSDARGYLKGGAFTEFPRDPNALSGPPAETPGMRNVQSVDKNGRVTWTQQAIGVGSDREGEAVARGYRSFAEAPQPVQAQINQALDTQGLRRAERQGVDAARLNAKPVDAETAKEIGAQTGSLAALRQLGSFSPQEVERYVGILNVPAANTRETLAGIPQLGVASDPRYQEFKAAVGRVKKSQFEDAGKALTAIEQGVTNMYTITGEEKNATEFANKLRNSQVYTQVARDLKLEMTRMGRGQIDLDEFDRRLVQGLKAAGVGTPTGGGSADERARRKFLGQ